MFGEKAKLANAGKETNRKIDHAFESVRQKKRCKILNFDKKTLANFLSPPFSRKLKQTMERLINLENHP